MDEENQQTPPLPLLPPKKRRKRANQNQRHHLVETLQANLDIARATELGITTDAKISEFWIKLTTELNLMGKKCARTAIEWQDVWALWCKKLRSKCRRMTASLQMDSPTTTNEEHLNEIEIKILDIISRTENDKHIVSGFFNQNEAGNNSEMEKQRLYTINNASKSTDFVSFSNQIENKQEEMAASAKSRKRTIMKTTTPFQGPKVECRVCLQYVCCENQCHEMFSPWNQNPEATIACYYTQVTNIQVNPSDMYTKYICFKCLGLLQNCVLFIEKAHESQNKLQMRYQTSINVSSESLWPKPIQVNKCLNSDNMIEIEVKQEVLSEEEVPMMETENVELKMDIKVEPEEYASYECSPQIMDTISITPAREDESIEKKDIDRYEDEHYLEEQIKEEPLSDDENEVTPDLPLDCMLCTKTFNFVSGLKAHVIAQHSYLTIARKPKVRPPLYQCWCKRTFVTHTDLIVHETCHGQYACYLCNSKYDTFLALAKHRKRCRYNGDHVSRLKTLDDVKRPSPDLQHTKIHDSNNKVIDSTNRESQPLHHPKTAHSINTESHSETEINKKIDSHITDFNTKTINATDKESKAEEIAVSYILDGHQSDAAIEINSPRDLNNSKSNDSKSEENNANSEVTNPNSELDIPNSVLDNYNSEINNSNCESTNSNQDLEETQTQIDVAHMEKGTENRDLNQPVPATNIKKTLSSDLSQKKSLNGKKANSTSPKLVSDSEVASCSDFKVLNSDHVSDSGNSVSKNSDLVSENKESVLEANNTKQSVIECAKSLEVNENSKENDPSQVAESDSMKIHLAIHSMKNKSLENLNKALEKDEKMIETPESNEDKVLQ